QMKQQERELADSRAALEDERTAFQAHVEKVNRELAAGRSALETERAVPRADSAPAQPALASLPPEVIRRCEELDAYARHLLLTREELRQQVEALEKAREQFQAERQGAEQYDREKAERYEQWQLEAEAAAKEYEWRREALAKEMAELREQRSQV